MTVDSDQVRLHAFYESLRERLLDLGNRNRLLNTPIGGRSRRLLEIVDTVPEEVLRRLVADARPFEIRPLPEPEGIPDDERTEDFRAALGHAEVSDPEWLTRLQAAEDAERDDSGLAAAARALRDRVRADLGLPERAAAVPNPEAEARRHGIDPAPDLPAWSDKPHHGEDGLQTLRFPADLEATLERIAGDARLATEEMGVSTLHLAVGFIERPDRDGSDKLCHAPLLMVPVRLEPRKVRGRRVWSLIATSSTAETNLSLQKLLERDHGRSLPDFAPDDDDPVPGFEAWLERVREAVAGLKRWRVRRRIVLGHFAFGRLAMYADLDPARWASHPAGSRLVEAILAGTDGDAEDRPLVPPVYRTDDPDIEKAVPYLVQDADASQFSALVDVMTGRDLVIEGPPGTGKSQTITNVVANAMAAGKTVLFLAEKQAALDAVKRRLDEAGLGEFCLELHSDKAAPVSVVDALRRRAELGWGRAPGSAPGARDVGRQENRRVIEGYLGALHAPDAEGRTAFGLIWNTIAERRRSPELSGALRHVAIADSILSDDARRAEIAGRLEIHSASARAFAAHHGHPADSPWATAGLGDVPVSDQGRVKDLLIQALKLSAEISEAMRDAAPFRATTFDHLAALVALDRTLGSPETATLVPRLADLDVAAASRIAEAAAELAVLDGRLAHAAELLELSPEALATAEDIALDGLDPALLDLAPAEARAEAERRLAVATRLGGIADGLAPVLRQLGLDRALAADEIETTAMAIAVFAALDPKRTALLGRYVTVPDEEFAAACSYLQDATEADADWRAQFPALAAEPWPSVAEIEAAVSEMTRGSLSRALSGLTGAGRAARALVDRLTAPGAERPTTEDLQALCGYLGYLEKLEGDVRLTFLFGPAWRGLATPLEACKALRTEVRLAFAERPGWQAVGSGLVTLGPSGVARIGAAGATAARGFLRLKDVERLAFDGCVMEEARHRFEAEREVARRLADRAPDPELDGIRRPIREIVALIDAVRRRQALVAALEAEPLWAEWPRLFPYGCDAAEVDDAAAWVELVLSARRASGLELTPLTGVDAGASRRQLAALARRLDGRIDRFVALREQVAAEFGGLGLEEAEPKVAYRRLDELLTHRAVLGDFLALRRQRVALAEAGIGAFMTALDEDRVPPDRWEALFEAVVTERRAAEIRRTSTALGAQTGTELDARRRAFAERDRRRIMADRFAVRERLFAPVPPSGSMSGPRSAWTEMALIRNEFAKQRRHVPVRVLIRRAGQAIQRLKPCFMMSPLSLAKYLEPGGLAFDLLVIDEASQMRPEDALGGLARAKTLVVVGDPKQLPPTDFFVRSGAGPSGEAERDEDEVDDESILDACRRTFRQVRRLNWHYRSRCESLIAFSNRAFYDDDLITFPVARPGSFSIDLVRVDGRFQARRNVQEAARIAEEAVAFMRAHAEEAPEPLPTLGIVALNLEQRELIAEELRLLEAGDEAVERYKAAVAARGEPVFVKNLENVQGDERDVILISFTYGKEPGATALKQRFGPINGRNGHRRLNVLFTRARRRIGAFASFGSEDVVPGESSHRGVHVLKSWFEYVETGGRAPVERIGGTAESTFELEVAARLTARGFVADMQVGVSGYRIDLGVRRLDRPAHYLAGIECDGAAYHAAPSARDRDRLREEVLRGLGWTLIRVWSTDWFNDPDAETDRLVRRLEELSAAPPMDPFTWTVGLVPPGSFRTPPDAPAAEEAPGSGQPLLPGFTESGQAEYTDVDVADPAVPDLALALERFRDEVIAEHLPDWQPGRSLLRPSMIAAIVAARLTDPADWTTRIPAYLRAGTDMREKRMFLNAVAALVAQLAPPEPEPLPTSIEAPFGWANSEDEVDPQSGANADTEPESGVGSEDEAAPEEWPEGEPEPEEWPEAEPEPEEWPATEPEPEPEEWPEAEPEDRTDAEATTEAADASDADRSEPAGLLPDGPFDAGLAAALAADAFAPALATIDAPERDLEPTAGFGDDRRAAPSKDD